MLPDEITVKMQRLSVFLDRHALDGVFLRQRGNFAWITGGRDNHVANNSHTGVAAILATRDGRICVTNSIEAPRMAAEEVPGMRMASYLWHDHAAGTRLLKDLIAGRKIAADVDDAGNFDVLDAGFSRLPPDFYPLRWTLTSQEIDRYRQGARRTAAAMEAACRLICRGFTEHQVAGVLDDQVHRLGLNPVVTLIAADQRIENFRHPIATENQVRGYVMLVCCASFGGLISNLTRFVSFAPVSADLTARFRAVCNVDAAVNLATRPGVTLGQMFQVLRHAYTAQGFPGQWDRHHQGGPTGYAGREAFATPDSTTAISADQAFAWNPSLPGVKSEDTILCTSHGIEVLTVASDDWPRITGAHEGQMLVRPGILLR